MEKLTYQNNPMTQKSIREEFMEWACIEEEYEATESEMADWWLAKLSTLLQTIESEIEAVKEAVQEQTGSFKYDDCYDDCLKIISKYKDITN